MKDRIPELEAFSTPTNTLHMPDLIERVLFIERELSGLKELSRTGDLSYDDSLYSQALSRETRRVNARLSELCGE
jgi:hypothetical protein